MREKEQKGGIQINVENRGGEGGGAAGPLTTRALRTKGHVCRLFDYSSPPSARRAARKSLDKAASLLSWVLMVAWPVVWYSYAAFIS